MMTINELRKRLMVARAGEHGSALLEAAMLMPVMVLVLVAAVDFGRGYYASIEVATAAEAGALYGTLNPTNTNGMQSAAVLSAKDVLNMTAQATYGCECGDGTNATSQCGSAPTGCSGGVVNYVEVDTVSNYKPILVYPGIPATMQLKGRARMRATE